MNRDEIKKSYENLTAVFGKVSSGVFTYYEFLRRHGNLCVFDLYYNTEFDEGKFRGKGNVQITITDDGKEYGIVAVNINSQ